MIQRRFTTTAIVMGAFLLSMLLMAATNVVQAAPVEHRSINKKVESFPDETDFSSPEAAMAAWCRAIARNDIKAMPELTWVWLDPQAAGLASNAVPAAMAEKMLNTKVFKVLTYREDLSVVIVTSSLDPSDGPYQVMPFGRIDGKWKSVAVDWRNAKDLAFRSPSIEAAEKRFASEKDDLWRSFEQIRDDVKNGRRASPLSDRQLEEIKRMHANTWAIDIQLDMPSLEPQAVQYAIVDKNPAPGYTAQVRQMQKFNHQQLENADTKKWKEQLRFAHVEVAWNLASFRDVTGDKLSLLTQPGRVVTTTFAPVAVKDGVITDSKHTKSRVSKAPAGKNKWLITKTVRIKEQPVCWSIPIEVKRGKTITVTLNKDNTFDLQKPYDEVMKEPDGNGAAIESK